MRNDFPAEALASALPVNLSLPEIFAPVFEPIRYKAFWGGRGGAKSHSLAGALVLMAHEGWADTSKPIDPKTGLHPRRGLRIMCCREIQNSIEDSVKQLIEDKIVEMGLSWFFRSTKNAIVGLNGSRFLFAGLYRNISKIKSKEAIDIVWVEEANTVSADSIEKLIPTIRKPGSQIWFSWNPENEDDPVDVMFRGEEPVEPDPALMADYSQWQVVVNVNWYDNPWFPDVLRIEMETDRKRDPDKYAHVWLGAYKQNSEARVFNNWTIGTHEEFEAFAPPNEMAEGRIQIPRYYFGGDFGFATDPSVLVRFFIIGRKLYIDRAVRKVGCEIDHLPFLFGGVDDEELINLNPLAAAQAKKLGYKGIEGARKWPITADSARPDTISYLRRHGFPRIQAAKKGAGSVEEGVEFLKSYDIVIHPDLSDVIDEFTLYSFKVDKKTKEVLPVLVDAWNHFIDSLRYALEGTRRGGVHTGAVAGQI